MTRTRRRTRSAPWHSGRAAPRHNKQGAGRYARLLSCLVGYYGTLGGGVLACLFRVFNFGRFWRFILNLLAATGEQA